MFSDWCRRKLLSMPDIPISDAFAKMSLPIAGRHKVPMRFGNPNHDGKPRKFSSTVAIPNFGEWSSILSA